MKWVVFATAPDQLMAEMWRGLLAAEGIAALIRPGDAVSFLGVSSYPCRLMVRERDVQRASEILGDQLGGVVD